MKSTQKKFYVAGRVTGLPRTEVQHDFQRGKMLLFESGCEPVSPLDLVPENSTPKEAMKILLPVLSECDGILMLRGSGMSPGAQLEKQYAEYIGIEVLFEDELN